jgi:GMP synthase (glutamine-hydrolysing)
MPKILLVRHGDGPADDRVTIWAQAHGFEIDSRRPFAGEMLPQTAEGYAATAIYGGMYNAFDTKLHLFLEEEYRWIDACLTADIPMLGICQGAQQIALHLGAAVGPKSPPVHEFGYYRITPTPEAVAEGFMAGPLHLAQAHFHEFATPEGAVRLGYSDAYENQAFRYGDKVYGFQFHAEATKDGLRRWLDGYRPEDRPGGQTLAEIEDGMRRHDAAQGEWFNGFLDRFIGHAA